MTAIKNSVKSRRGEVMYRIFYGDGWPSSTGATTTEYYRTELAALDRARELLERGMHHSVSLADGSGRVLAGALLLLKLGPLSSNNTE
jgi:hypothetical protein